MTTAAAPSRSRWTTPRRLRLLLGALWLGAALLFGVGLRALADDRAALRSLRLDSAPGIVTAQALGAELADLDTQLAVSLLGGAGERGVAQEMFELRRSIAARRLADAAGNVSLGHADRLPVVAMGEELGHYLELAARAQWLAAAGDVDGAIGAFRAATDDMHERILPQAAALDHAKRDALDQRYETAQRASRTHDLEALVIGAALVATLLYAQIFIRLRMRRRLVPGLLLATALTVAFSGYLVDRFRTAREDLRVARDDAFNSIHLLWRARAVAYDAQGNEGRWLLDRARVGAYTSAFQLEAQELASDATPGSPGFATHGLLAEELHNVTFQGEREAAQAAVSAFADYLAADERVRRLEAQGKHVDAVAAALGGRDATRTAFDDLDAALARATAINQDAFDAVLLLADRSLGRAEWLDPALALAIVLAAWLGIRPRLRDYGGG